MPTPNNGTAVSINNTPQAKDDVASATEDRIVTIDVMANDLAGNGKSLYSVDQVDPLHAALTGLSTMGATVRIVAGQIVYDSSASSAIQSLAAGQTATDTFTYVIQMGNGTLSLAEVKVTVTGTNDGPTLSADPVAAHALTEVAGATGSATPDTATATLAFADLDRLDTHTVTIGAPTAVWTAGATPAATLTSLQTALTSTLTDSTGSGAGSVALTFSAADRAFDFLAAGEKLTVTYNVTVKDNSGVAAVRPVTFVVTGTNDGPVLAADASATHALTERAGVTGSTAADTASVTLGFTDVDLTDSHTVAVALGAVTGPAGVTLPGSLAATLGGALSATVADSSGSGAGSVTANFSAADGAFDLLAQGQTLSVTYNLTVKDAQGASATRPVTFVVTGTNDGPVLSADAVASHAISELAGATGSATADTASVTLAFADVDLADTHTVAIALGAVTGPSGVTLPGSLAATLGSALSATVADSTGSGAGSISASFSAADGAFDFLAAGQTLSVTYAITVKDNQGATASRPVTFVITGSNDGPVLAADAAPHAVAELAGVTGSATADTASATLAFIDVDLSDTHSVGVALGAVTGPSGVILPAGLTATLGSALSATVADSTGAGAGSVAATFSAADSAFDFLAQGQTLTVTYNVTVTDNNGAASTRPVTFVVTGANDGPVLGVGLPGQGSPDEGQPIAELSGVTGSAAADTASTTLTFRDADLADSHVASVVLGSVTGPAGVALPASLAGVLGSAVSVSVADSIGAGAGSVTATFAAADKAFDFLAQGETLVVSYNVTVTDSNGAASTRPVSFVVTGSNDAPVLSVADHSVQIAERAAATGQSAADEGAITLAFTDVDLSDSHTVSVGAPAVVWSGGAALPAGLGAALATALSATLSDSTATGAGSVTAAFSAADNAFDFLAQGQTLTVTYNVTVDDGHGSTSTQPVTVVINGANDAPTIAAGTVAGGAVVENATASGVESVSGTIAFADVDLSDAHTVSSVFKSTTGAHGQLGTLTSAVSTDSTGSGAGAVNWTYTANDTGLQYLAAGETVVETFTVTVRDASGALVTQDVNLTLTGTNDAPVFAAGDGGELIRNGGFELGALFWNNTAGHRIEVGSAAGYGVTGTTGNLLELDADSPLPVDDVSQTVATQPGQAYTFSFDAATRAGTSPADNTFQVLWNGQVIDTVTPTSTAMAHHTYTVIADGGSGKVEFREVGSNSLGGMIDNVSLKSNPAERAGLTGFGGADIAVRTIEFTDVDEADTHTVSASLTSVTGTGGVTLPSSLSGDLASALSVAVDGEPTNRTANLGSVSGVFSAPDSTFDFLAKGQSLVVTYNVVLADNHGATSTRPMTFTIAGANDAPQMAPEVVPVQAVSELANATASSAVDSATAILQFADVDLSDTHTASAALGSITASAGVILPAGLGGVLATAVSTSVTDSTGTGQGAVLSTFSAADSTFDFLSAGQTLTLSYNVTVTDNNGAARTQPVLFVVTGSNDAPVLSAANPDIAIAERAGIAGDTTNDQGATTLAFSDVDLSDQHTVSVGPPAIVWSGGAPPAGLASTLATALTATLDEAGHSVSAAFVNPDNAFDFLAQGETLKITYNVTVDDGHGGTAIQPVTVTINGANDAPVIASGGITSRTYVEDGAAPSAAPIFFSDVDKNDVHTVSAVFKSTTGDHGPLGNLQTSIPSEPAGGTGVAAWLYQPNAASVQYLAAGQTVVETYTVTLRDASGATTTQDVSITIQGTNDAPTVLAAPAVGGVTENATPSGIETTSGSFAFGDVDLTDAHTVSAVFKSTTGTHGQLGSLTTAVATDSTGSGAGSVGWTYTANDSGLQYLAAGQSIVETYTVTVRDPSGALVTKDVAITLNGANDAPVLVAPGPVVELIQNGGFDLGAASWSNSNGQGVEVGNAAGTYGVTGNGNVLEIDVNAAGGLDDVSQTVATHAGETYTFSFDAAMRSGSSVASNTFQVLWNGQVIDTVAPTSTVMAHYSYTVVSAGTTGKVEFREVSGSSDGLGGIVDNVSLRAALTERAGLTGSSTADVQSRTMSFTDVDLADLHTVSVAAPSVSLSTGSPPAGLAASLATALSTTVTEANGVGSVNAAFSAPDSTFDFLAAGQTLTVTYSVTVNDGHGGVSTQPVSFVVTGTDDAPVVANAIADQSVNMLQAFSFTPPANSFTDVDSTLVWTATKADGTALPTWLQYNSATHTFSGTPAGTDVGVLAVRVTATGGGQQVSDTFNIAVNVVNQNLAGTAGADTLSGNVGADTLTGNAGGDQLVGGAGNDFISGDAAGVQGPAATASFQLSSVAKADLLAGGAALVTPAGATTVTLPDNDDGSSAQIDITSVFGSQGLNFFGTNFTKLYVNNNGNLTFGAANANYTPEAISAGSTPIIAPFWADVDTNGTPPAGTPDDAVSYNLDTVNGVFTATWSNVGYYQAHASPSNTFQLQLINEGNGDFDIVFRYVSINWTTGDASSGINGQGGFFARAGYNSGSGETFELPGSATAQMLNLETMTNTVPATAGLFVFAVRNGVVVQGDFLNGGAGQDTLIGGVGADTFVFHAGEAGGDVVMDFNPGDGDKIWLVGYGTGATFTQIDATHWQVNYGAGQHEVITFANGAPIQGNDVAFFSSSFI